MKKPSTIIYYQRALKLAPRKLLNQIKSLLAEEGLVYDRRRWEGLCNYYEYLATKVEDYNAEYFKDIVALLDLKVKVPQELTISIVEIKNKMKSFDTPRFKNEFSNSEKNKDLDLERIKSEADLCREFMRKNAKLSLENQEQLKLIKELRLGNLSTNIANLVLRSQIEEVDPFERVFNYLEGDGKSFVQDGYFDLYCKIHPVWKEVIAKRALEKQFI